MTEQVQVELTKAEGTEADLANTVEAATDGVLAMTVKSDTDYTVAGEMVRDLRGKVKLVKDWFKPMKDSAHRLHRSICDREKEVVAPLIEAGKHLNTQLDAYQREKERERMIAEAKAQREAEEKMLQAAAALEAAGLTEAADKMLDETELAAPPADHIAPPKVKGLVEQKRIAFEITNVDAISRRFMVPNEKAIRQACLDHGERAEQVVGGIRVFYNTIRVTR